MSQAAAGRTPSRFVRRRTPPPTVTGGGRSPRRLRYLPQYLAISPFYLLFAVFGLAPVLFSAWLSVHNWDGISTPTFVGLQQFKFLIADHTFWLSVGNTIVLWLLATVPMLIMSLAIAGLVNSVKRGRTFYQIVLFLPSVTSIVAVAIFFGAIFNNDYGVVNAALTALGLPAVQWLTGFWTIKIVLAILMTWQWVGYNAIIYFAGLQAIDSSLYEAAALDGAGKIRTFFSISVPLLRPVILFTVVISTITGLQSFTEPQVLFSSNAAINANNGGPGQAGLTMVLYFYQQAFTNNNFGYGAAIAYAVFAIIAVFAVVNYRLSKGQA